jgi:hypothetical protein
MEVRPHRSPAWHGALALLAYAVLVVVMDPALLSHGTVDLPDDYLEYGVADFAFFADEIRQGHLPAWNPYKLGGGSIFGDLCRMASHYPVLLLLAILPLDLAILLTWVLHLSLAALGVDRLARQLGAGALGGTAAGITCMLASPSVLALVDGTLDNLSFFALLPWTLVFLLRAGGALSDPGSSRGAAGRQVALAGLCLGLIGLGAHTRFAAISFAAVGLTGVVLWLLPPAGARPSLKGWTLALASALGLGVLLAAPVLLPTYLEISATRAPPTGDPASLVGQVLTPSGITGLVFPRVLFLDERWHHLGAIVLVCLLTLRSDRRGRALLVSSVVLVLLGLGAPGPLFFLVKPLHWLLYPVEVAVAVMAVPLLAAAVGLAVDRMTRPDGPAGSALLRAALVLVVGLVAVGLGWMGSSSIYPRGLVEVRQLAMTSAIHGAAAVAALALVIGLSRRLGPRRLGVALLVVILADGLTYAGRVQALLPSHADPPSRFVQAPEALRGLRGAQGPEGRVLVWPLRSIRDFSACLDDPAVSGHGWGANVHGDPLASIIRDARELHASPVPRNGGARAGIPHVGGRARVPPMPWSVFAWWLSSGGPLSQGAGPGSRIVRRPQGQGPPPARGPCAQGPLDLGAEGASRWVPVVLEILHVHWIVSDRAVAQFPGARPIEGTVTAPSRFGVSDPRPPALLSPRVERVQSLGQAEQVVFGDGLDLRRTAVVLASQVPELPQGAGGALVVPVSSWRAGRWDLALPSSAGLLTVAERFHPGWRARDQRGEELRVVAANFVQTGVVVPEGTTRVTLRFVAPGTGAGLLAGLLGLVLTALLGGWRRRTRAGPRTR